MSTTNLYELFEFKFNSSDLSGVNLVNGEFHAFSYAIGLSFNPEDTESPINSSITTECQAVYRHELTHLIQFCSTSIGVDSLRSLNFALRSLARLKPIKFPLNLVEYMNDHQIEDVAHFIDFAHLVLHELKPNVRHMSLLHVAERPYKFYLDSQPYHPTTEQLRQVLKDDEQFSLTNYANLTESLNAKVLDTPIMNIAKNGKAMGIQINAASLIECTGAITEILSEHFAETPHKINFPQFFTQLSEKPPVYWAPLLYFMEYIKHPPQEVLIRFSAIVDIALSLTSLSVYNLDATAGFDQGAERYNNVSDVFFAACSVSEQIDGFSSYKVEEFQKFQDEVTMLMGLPKVKDVLVKNSIKTKEWYDKFASSTESVFNRQSSVFPHYAALQFRLENFEGSFWRMLMHDYQDALVEIIRPCITFYDIVSKQPYAYSSEVFDSAGIAALITQSFWSDSIECPFKKGEIFKCGNSEANEFCKFDSNGRETFCPEVVFKAMVKGDTKLTVI